MINFPKPNNAINFTGLKIPASKFSSALSGILPGRVDKLSRDIFQKTLSIPQGLAEDGISEKTFNKARKYVMSSVLAENPKESIAVIKNDKIIYKSVCDKFFGRITDKKLLKIVKSPSENITIVHSHPKKFSGTMPVSVDDYETLERFPGIKKMYAINSDGEYSILKKVSERQISKSMLDRYYLTGYANWVNRIDDPDCKDFVDLYKYLRFEFNRNDKERELLLDEFVQLQNTIDEAGFTIGYVHNFWGKYAKRLGVEYSTNFSGLENKDIL